VQRGAMKTIRGEGRFRDNLAADADVAALLSADELGRCFDLDHALSHVDAILDRALGD
jgi:adenylosuccinate lyase